MRVLRMVTVLVLFSVPLAAQEHDSVFIFSYFTGNGADGLHLACSKDGMQWEAMNNGRPLLKPEAGNDKLMRDPCIIKGPDGLFHMVWTVSWNEKGIGYAFSEDLVNWSRQRYLPVMEHEPEARNCWAPEIFYDNQEDLYLIIWSTTIPGRFPETAGTSEDNYNHRMYYVTSRDLKTFSETKLFYDHGFSVIDGTISIQGDTYLLFIKNETRFPEPEKNIRLATGKSLTGPFSAPSGPIYGKVWAEGPTAVKIDGKWVVYFDRYRMRKMGAVLSSDLLNWEDISDNLTFPEGTRHGTILKISAGDLNRIRSSIRILNTAKY